MLGLNIFTYAINWMKQFLILIFLFIFSGLFAQQQFAIRADTTSGCNPLTISFSIQPDTLQSQINSILWDFGDSDTSILLSPVKIYTETGYYKVSCRINNLIDDVKSDFLINVYVCDSLELPNVFTPNDDNQNDNFIVKTNGIDRYLFSVFTRSGTLIYKSLSPAISWDGRSLSGQKVKSGIYFYIIRRLDGEPLNETKGFVYLFE